MFIKCITIQGFKTYKNRTVIDDLSPHFNVVVGRNGLGKSNFFSAIRFVLSDAYTHLTREERQALIHEGSGTVMSAYVEITFDNTDRRFPIHKDEIAIRRTIGLKKDDYSMDGKSATRTDIMNLLESAGFSKLNPYYIVPQGKITSLTNSKDSERLLLLKEVSGAKLFETKLKESNKEMAASQLKMDRIDESMEKLNEKLTDLQLELESLREYQRLEKEKKIHEFNIFDRELASLNTQTEEYDEKHEALMSTTRKDIADLEARERVCLSLQLTIDEFTSSTKVASLELDQYQSDLARLAQLITSLEAKKEQLQADLASTNDLTSGGPRAEVLSRELEKTRHVLRQTLPELQRVKNVESELRARLARLSTARRLLLSKKMRFQDFSTKAERDTWLKKELAALKKPLEAKKLQQKTKESEIELAEKRLEEIESRLNELRNALDDAQYQETMHTLENDVQRAKLDLLTAINERKELWRKEIKLKALHDSAQHELSLTNEKVSQSMNRSQATALAAVADITERLLLQLSVFGPLAELFSVSDKYKTAVETVAGSSLFHVVVDTDETASILMAELTRTKAGRITFMPLNRLKSQEPHFPDQEEFGFIPLIKKIKHNQTLVGKAINQVFGRTIVCKNLVQGSELARQYGLNAITLDGDRASNKGVLSGGFRENKFTRLDNLKLQAKKRAELTRLQQEIKECSHEVQDLEDRIIDLNRELELKTRKLEEKRSSQDPQKLEHQRIHIEQVSLRSKHDSDKSICETLSVEIANMTAKMDQYQQEFKSKFTKALLEAESTELELLKQQIQSTEEEYNAVIDTVAKHEFDVSELEDKILKHESSLQQLKDLQESAAVKADTFELRAIEEELQAARVRSTELSTTLEGLATRKAELVKSLEAKKAQLDKENKRQMTLLKRIETDSKAGERILARKAILDNRRTELQEKVRNVGVLPEEAFQSSRFEGITLEELYQNLARINNELKNYAHVNKRAAEQLNSFAMEQEDLNARKRELTESKASIENLVTSLQEQKDTAIKKSFEEVSKSFTEIFETLVPNGKGELVMASREASEQNRSSESSGQDQSIENYVGVSILVSFNSKDNEQQHIEQLSGGQKSLCAITLILAIQKCDPAPFYLFDEIDANLDTQYRTAVASIIQSLASKAQFICTSFRPEMLQVANSFYGISFGDKVSSVSTIEQEDALSFVESQS